ncbi:MAG TPA: prepilin-type N-terminal cleavage/methylation domain-containing protein [Candidatus Acidoferrales bacterium]|nr:prepilin-type N-terminal cleavage/methylation domain-containing protein [Candidatus Acidoferrales bacterium]
MIGSLRYKGKPHPEAGWTLIELVIVIAIIAMIMVFAIPFALSTQPGALASAEASTQVLVNETRALAASNSGAGNTGATLQFTFDATTGDTIEQTFLNRPMTEFRVPLILAPNVPEARFHGTVSLTLPDGVFAPPFAIFIGSAGHAAAAVGDFTSPGADTSKFLNQEPTNCNGNGASMTITFTIAGKTKTDAITCFDPVMSPTSPLPAVPNGG